MVGYIAIIKQGIAVYEAESMVDSFEIFSDTIDYFHIDMESYSYKVGNRASILINGNDYAVNCRGLNIVVLDLKSGKVADSVCFDTHNRNLK